MLHTNLSLYDFWDIKLKPESRAISIPPPLPSKQSFNIGLIGSFLIACSDF
jgi:hypothetical protein